MLYSKGYATEELDKPILIILHGLFGSSTNWHSMADTLSSSHRVYTLDLRNHGKSPWFEQHSYALMAQDVAEFIAHNKFNKVSLLGHSMGGKAAMQLALTNATLLDKLIVADIAPVNYADREHANLIQAMQSLPLGSISSRKAADTELATNVPHAGVRAFLLQNLVYNETEKIWQWRLNLQVLLASLPEIMAFPVDQTPCTVPSLFVYGKQSDYVSQLHQAAIKTCFPAYQLVGLDNAGHWLHVEQAAEFFNTCAEFLT